MNEIKLVSMELINFMGIKQQTLKFQKDITRIFGANGSGKTTFNTAFRWLLFNKDVSDRSDFEVKTLDKNNKVKHGLEHTVICYLKINGDPKLLQKTYKEIWRKKRGDPDATFQGHETIYSIDEVPMLKKDFDKALNDIITEESFKILTDPLFFSEKLHWKEERKLLMKVTGEVEEEAILERNEKLRKLDREGKTIEDFRASLAAKKSKLNKELSAIPTRIDEVSKQLHESDFNECRIELAKCEKEYEEIESFRNNLTVAAPGSDNKKAELRKINNKIYEIELAADKDFVSKQRIAQSKINEAEKILLETKNDIDRYKDEAERNVSRMDQLKEKAEELRKEWIDIDEQTFEHNVATICYVCNQALPEDQVEHSIEAANESFNLSKAANLQKINEDGKGLVEKTKGYVEENLKLTIEIKELETAYKNQKGIYEQASENIKVITKWIDPEIETLKSKAQDLELDLKVEVDNTDKEKYLFRKQQLDREMDRLKAALQHEERNEKIQVRIKVLMEEQKKISQQIADMEKQEYLTEEFIKVKVELLQKRIDEKFKYVKFKMFNVQINGAIDETCEALINGVPFSDANRAAKVNAGLDIINSLSFYYQINAPIWIDNRESITEIIPTKSQVINLVVEEKQKTLLAIGNQSYEEYLFENKLNKVTGKGSDDLFEGK